MLPFGQDQQGVAAYPLLGRVPDTSGDDSEYSASIYTLQDNTATGKEKKIRELVVGPYTGDTRASALRKLLNDVEERSGRMQAKDYDARTKKAEAEEKRKKKEEEEARKAAKGKAKTEPNKTAPKTTVKKGEDKAKGGKRGADDDEPGEGGKTGKKIKTKR